MFLILIVVHGSESWFNWHFPLTLLTVPFLVVVFLLYFFLRIKDMLCWKFLIEDISITSNKEFVMIYIWKPRNYSFKPGQYCFINMPKVSLYQWHPFSIASAPDNNKLIFMIKKNGDWTKKLIETLYESKKNILKLHQTKIDGFDENDVFNLLENILLKEKIQL